MRPPAFTAHSGTKVFSGEPEAVEPERDEPPSFCWVGWDDATCAWQIKHSGGADWGTKGYAWIAYNSNNIGASAAWVESVLATS